MQQHSEILNSWKEIATYLGRGTRTVQRWEIDLQLPVRRPRKKARSAVMAFRSELDQWLLTVNHECVSGIDDPVMELARLGQKLQRLGMEIQMVQNRIQEIKKSIPAEAPSSSAGAQPTAA
ncbi:MAG TPA: hypothetical protein VFB79_09040 [Candidatus Angelobacter sp.]|nr:hypothetical protein [Candidatus Angelobacter sp.]